MDIGCTVGFG